jgi:ribosomal protein S18 acetylase RimI-like enzyme
VTTVEFSIRDARQEDESFLSEMLYEAATWRSGSPRSSVEKVLSDPEVAVYISGWGRPGDEGLIAEAAPGEPVGAAWYRLFSQESHGFGFVDAETPEVAIAVRGAFRGLGLGSALLEALIARARERGAPALSLSVEGDNPAVQLYERASFRVVHQGEALTMLRDLAS